MNDKERTSVMNELSKMRNDYKLPEEAYFSIVFRAYIVEARNTGSGKEQDAKLTKLQNFIDEKPPKVPYLTMAELCVEAGKDGRFKELAILAIKKEKVYELKIQALIDTEAWQEACKEAFAPKRPKDELETFIEQIRKKGPPFVEDFIRDA